MSLLRSMAVGVVLSVLGIGSAQAVLIDQGVTSFDDETMLSWLDFSETIGRSYSDVSGQFGTGGDFEGYRYATINETLTLFENAGIAGVVNGFQSVNYQPIVDLAALFGTPLTSSRGIRGLTGELNSPGYWETYVLLADHTNMSGVIGLSATGNDSIYSDNAHFLVRTGYDVPEPASLALMALGLVGLGFTRRKKAA